jgi:hypothetical protein
MLMNTVKLWLRAASDVKGYPFIIIINLNGSFVKVYGDFTADMLIGDRIIMLIVR